MTNQANQAFEDFYNENKHLYTDTSPYGIMLTTFQAATQASEIEINALKQRVVELQADNLRLREALTQLTALKFSTASHIQKLDAVDKIANKALSSTPTQSLAMRDIIEKREQYEADLYARYTDPNE